MRIANIKMISTVAEGLGNLLDEVVFVGGMVTMCYATDPAATEIRQTLDVDLIVNILSKREYGEFEEVLRSRGFKNDNSPGAPICRWIYNSVTVDIMPMDESILGFSNRWYEYGYDRRVKFSISPNLELFILPAPIYIATKLEAVKGRATDLRWSHDFEDVVYILNSRESIVDDIRDSEPLVREYLTTEFSNYVKRANFREAVACVLPMSEIDRLDIIFEVIESIVTQSSL